MNTSTLIAALTVGLFSASAMHAQDTVKATTTTRTKTSSATAKTASFTVPHGKNRTRALTKVPLGPRVDGVVVRAVRSGHPLQMINPGAPAEYGSGQDMVRHEANDPYQRPEGIKLFVVEF